MHHMRGAGPRHVGAPGRLIIWRPGQVNHFAPLKTNVLFFNFFLSRTGLANVWGPVPKLRIISRENLSRLET